MSILLTSFDTWLNYQRDNASDRLLEELESTIVHHNRSQHTGRYIYCRRKLPVDIAQAGRLTLDAIVKSNARTVICCGMAETRHKVTLESNARRRNHKLLTLVDLDKLTPSLKFSGISHDAGQFVCEGLYYETLNYAYRQPLGQIQVMFVHVPCFTGNNGRVIIQDFWEILTFFLRQHYP